MYKFRPTHGEDIDYVVVGLGNPGKCYEYTRHNIGFKFIEYLQSLTYNNQACDRKLHFSLVNKSVLENVVVYLVRPQTYMNNSGMAVKDIMSFYKMPTTRLVIIHDDITLPVGAFKLKVGGSAGGHNGIKSIIDHLGTNDFIHIKVGIGKKPECWTLSDYVLSKFPEDEYSLLKERFPLIKKALIDIFYHGIEKAMYINNPVGKEVVVK